MVCPFRFASIHVTKQFLSVLTPIRDTGLDESPFVIFLAIYSVVWEVSTFLETSKTWQDISLQVTFTGVGTWMDFENTHFLKNILERKKKKYFLRTIC